MTNLAIIGGTGIMAKYTARALAPKCGKVYVSSRTPSEIDVLYPEDKYVTAQSPEEAVRDADFVVFCVPTERIGEYMQKVLPYCKKGAIISGQTSRKTPEADAFDRHMIGNAQSGLELVTIHTMCNPEVSDASKEILGIIRHRSSWEAYKRAREFYGDISEHIEEFESVDEHDTRVANTQINTSRTFLSIASAFAKVGCFPWANEIYSTAFDEMKFSLAMRVASQPAHVYRGIQFGSQHGKDIVSHAIKVERGLYRMIVGGKRKEYRQRVLAAKKRLFGDGKAEPILSDEAMLQFGALSSEKHNSHFSPVQYAVALAESGRGLFEDMKATTPMHTSLVGLTDRLFIAGDELEIAIAAPFEIPGLKADDLDFHDEIGGWSDALLFDNEAAYNSRHAKMRERIDEPGTAEHVKKSRRRSKEVVRVCREAMMPG